MDLPALDPEKRYYSMGEVTRMFDVNPSLIRFWEKEFDQLKPKKNRKGNRLFTPKDLELLQRIYHLVKERGFTLDGAKKKLRQNPEDQVDAEGVALRLKEIRAELVKLREHL